MLRAGNAYKIGSSKNPPRRHAEIQTMSPVLLELVWQHSGDTDLEFHLHHLFVENRLWGEWFLFEEDPLPAIKEAVESYLGKLDEPPELDESDPWDLG